MIYERSPEDILVEKLWWICDRAFGNNGQVGLAYLDSRQSSSKCVAKLEIILFYMQKTSGVQNWEYRHDNIPIHTSKSVKS
ncbi:hypothetical protein TNIN_254491 [Trichonephila inaurata madagascariensis]|uniref:Uncharacterized protein n=1 Tax=Trichonephila inaurata madagascariensis TaxID=2747483 RepID=A0A8X6YMF5_9ARAC|nr:hypothetical protein TNIN_254491 [Trichonephila inaurata madagascariensis]